MKNSRFLTLTYSYIAGFLLIALVSVPVVAQPVLSNIEKQDINYNAGAGQVTVTSSIKIDKVRFLVYSATIKISGGYDANEDLLVYTGDFSGINASWQKTTGTLTLSGYATESRYQTALRSIKYVNSNGTNPSDQTRIVSFSVYDGKYSNTVSRNINVIRKNVPPVIGNIETDAVIFCLNSGAVTVSQSITLNDEDDDNLQGAVIAIITGYTPDEDRLFFDNRNGISAGWNSNTGQLTLTGEASVANYQEALRSIRYENSDPENPHTGFHEITFLVNDGSTQSNIVSRNIVHHIPTAKISGNFSICRDASAAAPVEFTGTGPWTFTYRIGSGNPKQVQNVTSNPLALPVNQAGQYTLIAVTDKFCPGKVSGSAVVELLPEPDVSITGLAAVYTRQSTEMIPLTGIPGGGTFSGPGVVPYGEKWFFFPSLPAPGIHSIVYKYRADPSSCYGYDTVAVRILERSAAIETENNRTAFCNNDPPFSVTGINLLDDNFGTFTITGGRGLVDHGNNTATIYPDSLEINHYTVTYTAPDGNPASQVIQIGGSLIADFKWSAECFNPDEHVLFTNTSVSPFGFLTSESYTWTITTGSDSVIFTSRDIGYNFAQSGNYIVKLNLRNSNGCINKVTKVFPLRPVFELAGSSYSEDFEGEQHWQSGNDPAINMNSWILGKPDLIKNGFSDAYSGEFCWFTDINMNPVPKEESWITSPCFDFRGTEKPTLVARLRRSFTDNRDGSYIDYTTDNGEHWNLVGTINDGIQWYNGYFGNPGAQSQGWTAVIDNDWVESRHVLDFIKDEAIVQFRINFVAHGSAIGNKGIAIDDIKIVERNRTILIEHFTNTTPNASAADITLDNLTESSGSALINLQYHTSDPEDPFYLQNPVIPDARQFYYGITRVPYSIVNGGIQSSQLIDYEDRYLTSGQISIESLYDSDFNLKVTTMLEGNRLYAESVITSLRDVPVSELSLRMAVIEPLILDGSVEGPDSVYRNVVRTMLPDAGGNTLYREWKINDSHRIVESWDIDNVSNPDGLRVVAFIQNERTREINQASIDERGIINSAQDIHNDKSTDYTIFPVPAGNRLWIDLNTNTRINSELLLELISPTGDLVYSQSVTGVTSHSIDVSHIPAGIYILRISSLNGDVHNRKIIISR